MNGYERISAALNDKPSDTTPIMLHNFMLAAKEFGVTMDQFRNDPRVIADAYIHSIEKYQYDGILVDIDTVTLAGALGVPVDFPENEPARANRGCISALSDVDKLKEPYIGDYKHIMVWLEAVRILKDHFRNEIFIRGNCDQAPYSLASMMRGAQEWLMDLLIVEEEHIFKLLEYCTIAVEQFIELMVQAGADMVSNGDSTAGPELISRDMYLKYAYPYERRIVDYSHSKETKYLLHICGDTELILDDMIYTGADALELDYKTNIDMVYEKCSDKVTFFGNLDPSGVLAHGTVELVEEKTRNLLEVYKDSNRLILNAGCAIPPTTPEQNILAMIRTAREFKR